MDKNMVKHLKEFFTYKKPVVLVKLKIVHIVCQYDLLQPQL